ncbi:MAG: UDP-N-acetylenolpyruvoylglucosamine reductase [Herbaspirillum sp.]|jgi:UDP-N-acetylmuramate dehydrogenase|nr:UDP-N-acetylenolpyruvoylglucosamine reductase [Herbaspirillum sp.]
MFPIPLQRDFPLRNLNTFGIDAAADAYLPVVDADLLRAVRNDAVLAALPRLVLGGGSNLLLTRDFPGLVLHMRNTGIAIVDSDDRATYVRAAAGENWHRLVLWTLEQGLGGLENLSLIPGNVGASPIQNIGAYGVEIKDILHSLTIYDFISDEISTLHNADCEFAYRDSIFKHALRSRAVVLDVTFALPRQWQPQIGYAELAKALAAGGSSQPTPAQISQAVIAIRSAKLPDPAVVGNAGSFFKNPVVPAQQRNDLLQDFPGLISYIQADGSFKLAAGWLIDQCGWKGKTMGAAGVYPQQALVLVNNGGASGAEIVALARAIQADVQMRFGVMLEPEPVFI